MPQEGETDAEVKARYRRESGGTLNGSNNSNPARSNNPMSASLVTLRTEAASVALNVHDDSETFGNKSDDGYKSDDGSKTVADEKAQYRSKTSISLPGVSAVSNSGKEEQAKPVVDEKAQYRSSRGIAVPGVSAVNSNDSGKANKNVTPSPLEAKGSQVVDEKAAYRKSGTGAAPLAGLQRTSYVSHQTAPGAESVAGIRAVDDDSDDEDDEDETERAHNEKEKNIEQTPTFDNEHGVDDDDNATLLTAELVNRDEENQRLEDQVNAHLESKIAVAGAAQIIDEEAEAEAKAQRRNKQMMIYICIALVLAAIVVVVVVVSVKRVVEEANETDSPTLAPTVAPTSRRFAVLQNLENLLEDEGLADFLEANPDSPQARAVDWLVDQDLDQTSFPVGGGGDGDDDDDDDDDDEDPEASFVDRYALAVLGYATGVETSWTISDNWLNTEVSICEWSGVTCNDEGRPGVLDLAQRNLTGSLPSEIGVLDSLDFLYLFQNELTGPLPETIGNLGDVDFCHLQQNKFSGPLPESISGLLDADELYLFDNQFTGPLPDSLGGMVDLLNLYLHNNNFTGPIPATLGRLKRLQRLYLQDNSLSGEIPGELSGIVSLTRLQLQNNALEGPIPSDLGNFLGLTELQLHGNRGLTGVMPEEICDLRPPENDNIMAVGEGPAVISPDALSILTVDCNEGGASGVTCDCCSHCFQP